MSDPVIVSAVVATIGTIVVGIGGAVLGRRWGLPGLGREVQTQQAALIQTLQAEVAELRTQQTLDTARIAALEASERSLREELSKAESKINRQQVELLKLYRLTGKTVPNPF